MSKPLTIFILSVGEKIYSTNRIFEEARKLGHTVHIVNMGDALFHFGN